MSKKKNKKFFKKSAKASQPDVSKTTNDVSVQQSTVSGERLAEPFVTEKNNDPYAISILNERYLHVRKDVNKLLIVLGTLVIILIGTYFLGQKTTILSSVGDWLYKLGNFSIQ